MNRNTVHRPDLQNDLLTLIDSLSTNNVGTSDMRHRLYIDKSHCVVLCGIRTKVVEVGLRTV